MPPVACAYHLSCVLSLVTKVAKVPVPVNGHSSYLVTVGASVGVQGFFIVNHNVSEAAEICPQPVLRILGLSALSSAVFLSAATNAL